MLLHVNLESTDADTLRRLIFVDSEMTKEIDKGVDEIIKFYRVSNLNLIPPELTRIIYNNVKRDVCVDKFLHTIHEHVSGYEFLLIKKSIRNNIWYFNDDNTYVLQLLSSIVSPNDLTIVDNTIQYLNGNKDSLSHQLYSIKSTARRLYFSIMENILNSYDGYMMDRSRISLMTDMEADFDGLSKILTTLPYTVDYWKRTRVVYEEYLDMVEIFIDHLQELADYAYLYDTVKTISVLKNVLLMSWKVT